MQIHYLSWSLGREALSSSPAPPSPATKSHYTFNLRDISRVMQGFLMMTPDLLGAGQMAKDKYLRLWVHEVRGNGLAGQGAWRLCSCVQWRLRARQMAKGCIR